MRIAALLWIVGACGETAGAPTGEIFQYVVSGQVLTTGADAIDLNGDKTPDNQVGRIGTALLAYGMAPNAETQRLIDRGAFISLLQVEDADPQDTVALTLDVGTHPDPTPCADELDTTCRRHLQGEARFDVLLENHVAFGFFGTVVELPLLDPRARIAAMDDRSMTTVIGGGVPESAIEGQLIPALAKALDDMAGLDCAGVWISLFDTDHDCVITREEVAANPIVQSLFAPDLVIDGEPVLSIALALEAVPASF